VIAARYGCATQTVRNAIRAFHADGAACLREGSHRPGSARRELDDDACGRLRALLHRSPRDFGKPTSLWTLALAAEVAFAEGVTARRMSDEAIRQAIKRLGCGWRRAKAWITSPDPAYLRKKGRATA
jgi:transposase